MTDLVILLFYSKADDAAAWADRLQAQLPALEVRVWPDTGDVAEIDYALVWKPKPGLLAGLPNLRLILSLGMGVDHIFIDPDLPTGVPVARIVDPNMAGQMSEWVLLAVLREHRQAALYGAQQRAHAWEQHPIPDTEMTTIGVMGLGELGADAATKLAMIGFPVVGWSRSAKTIDGVECYDGAEGLRAFLARSQYLVCLLPLTPETEGIIDAELLSALPQGAHVINSARGGHVVEEDLLAAIDRGHISGATLDVFRSEPLPTDHAFWDHPKIHVFPHMSALTNPRTAADQVAENIRRCEAGEPILNQVDPKKGY